jgi:hypothetical protein
MMIDGQVPMTKTLACDVIERGRFRYSEIGLLEIIWGLVIGI